MLTKISIAASSYPPFIMGGGEISTQSLAEMLVDGGHKVQVISFSSVNSREVVNGVNVVRIKPPVGYCRNEAGNKSLVNKVFWRIREEYSSVSASAVLREISDFGAEVVITSTIEDVSTFLWALLKKFKIPSVHILRSYYLTCLYGSQFKNGQNCLGQCMPCRFMNLNKKRNSQYLSHVVGISQSVLDEHVDKGYFPGVKSSVIYNNCELGYGGLEKGVKTLGSDIVLGYLGRIHQTKGIEDILEAVLAMGGKRGKIEVLVAGDGEETYVSQLKSFCGDKDLNVQFLGYVSQRELLSRVDFLVVPSRWKEPFGRVVAESILHGVPVIGRAAGGIPELIDNDSGYLYESVDDLKDVLLELADGKGRDFSFSNASVFSKQMILNEWQELLKSL